jgi:hypothetical protein
MAVHNVTEHPRRQHPVPHPQGLHHGALVQRRVRRELAGYTRRRGGVGEPSDGIGAEKAPLVALHVVEAVAHLQPDTQAVAELIER